VISKIQDGGGGQFENRKITLSLLNLDRPVSRKFGIVM